MTFEYLSGLIVASTARAIKLRIDKDTEIWIPRSVITDGDDFEIDTENSVDMEVSAQWCEQRGVT